MPGQWQSRRKENRTERQTIRIWLSSKPPLRLILARRFDRYPPYDGRVTVEATAFDGLRQRQRPTRGSRPRVEILSEIKKAQHRFLGGLGIWKARWRPS
jgi:hypothetical protein